MNTDHISLDSSSSSSSSSLLLFNFNDATNAFVDNNDSISMLRIGSFILSSPSSSSISSTILGKLYSIIERIPTLIESVNSNNDNNDESLSVLVFIESCLEANASSDFNSRINKLIPKIVNSVNRICGRGNYDYGLQILSLLVESSSYRTNLIPYSSSILSICTHAIGSMTGSFSQARIETASMIIAHINSMDTVDNWHISLDQYSKELLPVLISLGLVNSKTVMLTNIPINEPGLLQSSICSSYYKNKAMRGAAKVMILKRCYFSFCKILEDMLRLGCTTGAISLDVSNILSIITAVVTSTLDINSSDPRNKIDNEFGVSLHDVSMILSQLKVYSMNVVKSLLGIQQPILNRISSYICRILNYLMASKEIRVCKQLAMVSLECLRSAALCFPTSLARSTSTSTAILTDMLLSEITFITSSASLLTTQLKGGGDTKEKSFEDTSISRLTIEVAETVLLCCGPLLPSNIRDLFEISVGQGLSCLVKGVSLEQYQDKRIKRTPCALLRQDPYLQKAFLSLALTEFISSSRNGVLSGNAPLLRKAAELCLSQPDVGTTARRVLMVLETVIVPSAVPIPCVPMHILAKVSLEKQVDNDNHDLNHERDAFNDMKTSIFSTHSIPSTLEIDGKKQPNSDNHGSGSGSSNDNNSASLKSVREKNKKRTDNDNDGKSFNKDTKRVKASFDIIAVKDKDKKMGITDTNDKSNSNGNSNFNSNGNSNSNGNDDRNDNSDNDSIPDIVMF